MPDYKEMYFKLFRAHCKVLAILEQAGLETEKMAMEANEPLLLLNNAQGINNDD